MQASVIRLSEKLIGNMQYNYNYNGGYMKTIEEIEKELQ
jgi:hypothetical protein